jgi:hypothetical protein
MVTAIAADEFERVGVATLRPTLDDAGWLAAENNRPAMPGLITGLHAIDPTSRASPEHHPNRVKGEGPARLGTG